MSKSAVSFVSKAAKKEFERMPDEVQDDFTADFSALLKGRTPFRETSNIAKSVGPGAIELKINGSPAYRCVYVAKFGDRIYILHTFEKTTNGVDKPAMKVAKERYKQIAKEHKKKTSNVFTAILQLLPLVKSRAKG